MTSELGILFIMLFLLLSGALSLAFQWWGARDERGLEDQEELGL